MIIFYIQVILYIMSIIILISIGIIYYKEKYNKKYNSQNIIVKAYKV